MNEVAVSEARSRLAEVIDESRRSGEPISVTRRGRRVAVIVGSDDFDRLVDSADDVEDRRELDAARADDDYVPWDTDVGPLITAHEATRVESSRGINEARERGGVVVRGGERSEGLVSPAVVLEPPKNCRLWRDEVFGPVVGVASYEDFDEALALANDTHLALQVGVWTSDVDKALAAIRALDFGGVFINEVPTFRADQQPYGGTKDAGNTREGPAYTVREMTREKFVMFSSQLA